MTAQPESTERPGSGVAQTNHQTLHVHVHTGEAPAPTAGRIAGLALQEEGGVPLGGCPVALFFGPVGEHPVATCRTDPAGAFAFDDLPPGFYGLRLSLPGERYLLLHNLRLRAGETAETRLVITGRGAADRWGVELDPEGRRFSVPS
jgi:hypothetical protein